MEIEIVWAALFALLAGFVDSVVGGGGLVQVPALFVIFPHFLVPQVIATNRFASVMGTSVAVWQYLKKIKIDFRAVIPAAIGAAMMSFLGAKASSIIDATILKPVILVLMLCIVVYTYTQKNLGADTKTHPSFNRVYTYNFLIGAILGFYNGLIGPGTGSLLVFALVSVVGYNFLTASTKAKIINVVADVFSLIAFLAGGFVVFKVALPMMVCNMLGSYLGSRMAILKGNTFVRKFFLVVILLLITRFAYDIFYKN